MYWENKPGTVRPAFLDLCIDTVYNHCNDKFSIRVLDKKTQYNYLPHLRADLQQLPIPQKTDYLRIALLYQYGGIWMDVDTIVMSDLSPIITKLEDYDFVGFGCTGHTCQNGKPRPSNQLLAARKGSILMNGVLHRLNTILDKKANHSNFTHTYFDFGKIQIWKELDTLRRTQNYQYYHYDSKYDGSRKYNGRWVSPYDYFKPRVDLLDESRLFVVFLSYSFVDNYKSLDFRRTYDHFLSITKQDILDQDWWISSMFRKSLG